MREIDANILSEKIADMCIRACVTLPADVKDAIYKARECENYPPAIIMLDRIIENFELQNGVPVCQDTGAACVFLELGQDVHISGNLTDAVNTGVAKGYIDGYLRKSIVLDPLERVNTNSNTPAMIYTELIPGDQIKITVAPKGFGSENMSGIKMLKPSDGIDGIKQFVLNTVECAGANPCPPVVVGVGIGGTFDKAALCAKKALLRNLNHRNSDEKYAKLELELLELINSLGIGPQGFGGYTTALAVNIETMPTHITALPCAVNIGCHVSRHVTEVI